MLKKLNAVLSLLTTLLLVDHALFFSAWMMSGGTITVSSSAMPYVLAGLMVVHAAISVFVLVVGGQDGEGSKGKSYPKENISTIVQRLSGGLIIILLAMHITSAASDFQPKMLHAIIEPLFFAASFAHVALSTGKALTTLGVGNAKVIKAVNIVMKVLCAAALIFGVVSLYIYLFAGAM